MANSRRQRRTSSAVARTTGTTIRPSRRTVTAPAVDVPESGMDSVNWDEEYAYVYQDLRHLAIVTTGLFALLLIIGYFM